MVFQETRVFEVGKVFMEVPKIFQESFEGVYRKFQQSFKAASRVFQGSFKGI